MLCCAPCQTGFEAPADAVLGSVLSCIKAVTGPSYVIVSCCLLATSNVSRKVRKGG